MVDISAEELLAHSFQKLEEEHYLPLKLRLEQLLNLFNSDYCLHRIESLGNKLVSQVRTALTIGTVENLMLCLRDLLSEDDYGEVMILLQFFNSPIDHCLHGILGVYSTSEFKAVLDNKHLNDETKIRNLFEILKNVSHTGSVKYETPSGVPKVAADLREGNEDLNLGKKQFIQDIVEYFMPLRKVLVRARATSAGVQAGIVAIAVSAVLVPTLIPVVLVPLVVAQYQVASNIRVVNRGENWFEKTIQFLTDFVLGKETVQKLQEFIRKEDLQEDYKHFHCQIGAWMGDIDNSIKAFCTARFNVEALLMELDRSFLYVRCLLLDDPADKSRHAKLVQNMTERKDLRVYPGISLGWMESEWIPVKVVVGNIPSGIQEEILQAFGPHAKEPSLANGILTFKVKKEDIAEAMRKKFAIFVRLSVQHILLGDFSLNISHKFLNPAFNRIYGQGLAASGFKSTFWSGHLQYGKEKYFCPSGWRRYSIMVAPSSKEFDEHYNGWAVAYHGTRKHFAMSILINGLQGAQQKASSKARMMDGVVYFSPSIIYAAHPRYSTIWKVRDFYIQMVLQVRVKPEVIKHKEKQTLKAENHQVDPNFANTELEWLVEPDAVSKGEVIVYGIMVRVSREHPFEFPESKWWSYFGYKPQTGWNGSE